MHHVDNEIKYDIEILLNDCRPRLIEAYESGETQSYHATCEEFIQVAYRVFMSLYENTDITWFAFEALGSSLCKPSFWRYTNLIQSFCEYLELRSKEIKHVRST